MQLSGKFDWPEYTGKCESPVFDDLSGPSSEWGILVPHEGMRCLFQWVRELMPNFHPNKPGLRWQQECLGDWLKNNLYLVIFYHHEIEENLFIPELRKLGAKLGEKAEAEHADLIPRLKDVTHRLTEDPNTDIDKWKADILNLFDDLEEHMQEEEKEFGPAVLAAGITDEQNKQIMEKMIPMIPFNVMKLELPIIFYAMHKWFGNSEAISTHFKKEGMPAPLFFFGNWFWIPTFFDDTVDRFAALNNMGAPYQPRGCLSCFVAKKINLATK